MYMNSYYQSAGNKARLEIPIAGNESLACLQFWYHMYGSDMGSLAVFSGNAMVFNASGNHGNHWIKATRNIYLDNTVSNDFINTVTRRMRLRSLIIKNNCVKAREFKTLLKC